MEQGDSNSQKSDEESSIMTTIEKPGWRTSEFWTTVGAQALALAVALGVITKADSDTLGGALTEVVAAAFALISNALIVVNYVHGRIALKREVAKK